MLFSPQRVRGILRQFASTDLINYSEISLRLIVGVSLIISGNDSRYPIFSQILGWFMTITALVLYIIPRIIHYNFSLQSADRLKPLYIRLLAPLAFLFGGFIIYNLGGS